MAELINGGATSVPVPDPTTLTTAQLYREVTALSTIFDAKIDNLIEKINHTEHQVTTAISDAEKRTQDRFAAIEHSTSEKVGNLQLLHSEKFTSIQTQFTERDVRTEQTSRDSKVAVDAALQAAKEAVMEQNRSSALAISKSEAATNKQIDQLGVLIGSTTQGSNDKTDDLKERLTRLEGTGGGQHQAWGYAIGIAGTLIAILVLIFTFFHH